MCKCLEQLLKLWQMPVHSFVALGIVMTERMRCRSKCISMELMMVMALKLNILQCT